MDENCYQDCSSGLIIPNEDSIKMKYNEHASPLTSPDMFNSNKERKNWLSLNSFQYHNQSQAARERVINIIKVLADLIIGPTVPDPLYIGIFNKTTPGIRTTHLNKLAEEISARAAKQNESLLKPSRLLFLFPCVSSILSGFIFGITINWVFGVVLGVTLLVLVYSLIALILIGSKGKRSSKAVCASKKLAKFMERIDLLLQILFCYPTDTDLANKPIIPLILTHNLADYPTAHHLTLAIVESIWVAVENKYLKILTRLQCSCKEADSEGRFKHICCLPTFVLVLIFLTAVMINSTLLSIYHKRVLAMFTNTTLLLVFVLMTCIIFLGFFGSLPMFCKMIIVLFKSPARVINELKKAENPDFSLVDNVVKLELQKVCMLISTFEAYQAKEQLRIFILVNSTDNCHRQKLANCIYLLQNLTTMRTTVPTISVLAADFHTLINDWTLLTPINSEINLFQQFSDSFHLLHSTFHLPVYMDEAFNFIPNVPEKTSFTNNEMFCLRGGSSFESLNMAISGSKSTPLPIASANRTQFTIKMETMDSNFSIKKIQQMFLAKPDIAEINTKIIKQLLISAIFIEKVLKINNIDFVWDRLVDWIILCINWPFRMNLIINFLVDEFAAIDAKISLKKLHDDIMEYLKFENLNNKDFMLLAQDDKSLETFEAFLSSESFTNLSIDEIKIFVKHSSFLNPYIQSVIIDHMSQKLSTSRPKSLGDIPVTAIATNDCQTNSNHNVNEESLKTPIAVRKCFTKVKDNMKVKDLSQLSKKDVINLLNHIDSIDLSKITKYQSRLIDLNVTGLVLSICDLDNLQKELEMNFGDFQIFKALILYLRELESIKMVNLTDSEEIGEISPQIFDNLAFWTEPEHETNYGSDNDQSQLKSLSSSGYHRDTAPIIANDSKVVNDRDHMGKESKKTKSKSNGKTGKSNKFKHIVNHSPFHSSGRFHEHMHSQNPAYTSLSESVDKINSNCKKYNKGEYTTTYIPVIIPNTADVPSEGDNVKRCTCDYWFTIGKEKVPLSRFISDPVHCLNSHGDSDDGSDDDEFNPRLSCILPDSVTTNKLN